MMERSHLVIKRTEDTNEQRLHLLEAKAYCEGNEGGGTTEVGIKWFKGKEDNKNDAKRREK